jgi:hypothetical protein
VTPYELKVAKQRVRALSLSKGPVARFDRLSGIGSTIGSPRMACWSGGDGTGEYRG